MPDDFYDYATLGEFADEWASRDGDQYEFSRNKRLEVLLNGIWLGQLGGLIHLTSPSAFFRCVRAYEPTEPRPTDFSTRDRLSLLRMLPIGDPHMPLEFAEIHVEQLERQPKTEREEKERERTFASLTAIRFQDYPEPTRRVFERQLAVSREVLRQWDRKYGHVVSQARAPTDDAQQYRTAKAQPTQVKPGPPPTKTNLAFTYWRRRQMRGEMEESLAKEAAAIAKEIANEIGVSDSAGIPSKSTIEKAIRDDFSRVRGDRLTLRNSAELRGMQ